jgi:hypothetical protein
MTPADIDLKVVTQRATWILEIIGALRDLPLQNKRKFFQNKHNVAAAESYLRLGKGDRSFQKRKAH